MRKFYTTEEIALVEKTKKGDRMAQLRLYRKYVKAMYNTVVRMIPNQTDAEDIVQDVFVNVFKNIHSFKGDSSLGAWIKRITINQTLNFLRKNRNIRFVELEEQNQLVVEPEAEDSFWNMEAIHGAIKKLPEGCRVVFSLYLLEGYRHKEIASFLNVTESTSKTQYRRAKKLLQEQLKSPYYEGG